MLLSLRKKDSLVNVINNSLVDLPSPSSLSYFWNFGSLLGVFLSSQILSGLFLAFQFSGEISVSFDSVIHLMRDVNYGWFLRILHANGASFFFLLMYIHMGRGIYYGSYRFKKTWMSGVTLLFLSMATAFLGYVLPWGQMSFWAATVITNLLSAVPYIGLMMVEWVWGGFSVGNPTLVRFFSFHFVLPFVILFLVMLHLVFLHETGSGNPLGLGGSLDSVVFHPYFVIKDLYGIFFVYFFYAGVSFLFPYIFMDAENFISSNPMVTPVHIQPEWYFLFAYTILRSVPSKIGGVVALLMSIIILYFLPFFLNSQIRSSFFYFFMKILFWMFVVNWMLLTWIGTCEVDYPFMQLGMLFSVIYFLGFGMMWTLMEFQDLWIY